MRSPLRCLLPLAALLAAAPPAAAWAGPPAETLERLDRALRFLAQQGPARSASVCFKTAISKPDGSDAEEQVRQVAVSVGDDGVIAREVLQVMQDGVDVTDDPDAQAGFGRPSDEEAEEIDESHDEGGAFSVSLTLPAGDDLGDYVFGATEVRGGIHLAAFEPVDGKSRKERTRLSVGTLAWDPRTLDPLWVEFAPARNPRFIQRMDSRMEFTRAGDWLYPVSTVVDGVGGFLLYKRRMTFEMTLSDVR